jgi:hypothetical protein
LCEGHPQRIARDDREGREESKRAGVELHGNEVYEGTLKLQVQSSKEAPNPKSQNNVAARLLELGSWAFELVLSSEP